MSRSIRFVPCAGKLGCSEASFRLEFRRRPTRDRNWTLPPKQEVSVRHSTLVRATLTWLAVSPALFAQTGMSGAPERDAMAYETDHGAVVAVDATGVYPFANWDAYFKSPFFYANDMRCGHRTPEPGEPIFGTAADCSNSFTNPAAEYSPSNGPQYRIPVVVHILQHPNGSGAVSDALVNSQIDVLNEDFQALAGSLGENGNDASIEFFLATTDPNGNPSTGITRSTSGQWYNDGGGYYNSLAWDTTRYLNIYTNTAGGNLGYAYVPSGGGVVGNVWDRVVVYWAAFGRNAPIGPPYNLGRTTTHEVGHYLGLYHTFQGGCASASNCNANGDLICDTNPESSPNYSPCSRTTCGSPDPTNNYMDYSDDICMTEFTVEQVRRMRCTLENFRVDLPDTGGNNNPPAKVANPSPANGATGVSTSADLSWGSAAGATGYDVYFGTSANPPQVSTNQAGTSYDPGSLSNSTTYFWRVDSVNANGTTTGDAWSFTTSGGGGGVVLSATGFKVKGRWNADLSWTGNPGTVDVERSVNGGSWSVIATTSASSYSDSTTFKGGGSMSYRLRQGGSLISNTATVIF